jgi:hypothetical protein
MSNEDKDVFQQQTTFTVDPGIEAQGTTFTVPPQARLVIEQIGASIDLPPGQKLSFYVVSTTAGGVFASYFFDPANNPKFSCTQRVRIYADPNTQVELFANRDHPQGQAFVFISVSGYLVTLPGQ